MTRDKIIQFLSRFVPVVGRGLALGFGVLAVATAVFGMGDYSAAADRYLMSGVYGVIAVVSLAVARVANPVLRKLRDERQPSGPLDR